MIKTTLASLILCSMMAIANSAWAIHVGTIDVGARDTFIQSTALSSSGDGAETAWLNSVLGTDYEVFQITNSGGDFWNLTDQTNTYAFQLQGKPDYFMIKTGNLRGVSDDHFLFQNNASLEWAVLNLEQDFGPGIMISGIGKISHVTQTEQENVVPEPATVMLLGAGLIGLGIFGRRRGQK